MPAGYHRSSKPQEWNGSGMTTLSPAQRVAVMKEAGALQRQRRNGWPESVQKEGEDNKHTYRLADEEWAKRMAASKSRC